MLLQYKILLTEAIILVIGMILLLGTEEDCPPENNLQRFGSYVAVLSLMALIITALVTIWIA